MLKFSMFYKAKKRGSRVAGDDNDNIGIGTMDGGSLPCRKYASAVVKYSNGCKLKFLCGKISKLNL